MGFKALVFAAGIGSRLKPFTDSHPKALVAVGGMPLLERVLRRLAAAGADGIVVNIHHFGNQIVGFLASRQWEVPIAVSDESALLLDTAGAMAKIVREQPMVAGLAPNDIVMVHNADIYTDVDLAEMAGKASRSIADALLLVDPQRQSSRRLMWDADRRLHGWMNTNTGEKRPETLVPEGLCPAAFGGIHVVRRSLLDKVSHYVGTPLAPASITDFYIDSCATADIRAHIPSRPYAWHDVGTPEKLAAAERHAAAF